MKLFCLALSLSIASGATYAKTVFADLFVFKTGNSVYSLSDLKNYSDYLSDMKCFLPGSLTYEYYRELARAPKAYFDIKTFKKSDESVSFKRTTNSFISLLKMVRYASSQSVSVNSSLPKAFKLSAQKNGCSLRGFSGNGLNREMLDLAYLEIFLRSRFAPTSKAGELPAQEKANVLSGIRSLEDSVGNQIDHEILGN